MDLRRPDEPMADGLAEPDEGLQPSGCEPGTGCFGEKCHENTDCQSGWCIDHMGDGICTQTCTEECPQGFKCQQLAAAAPDLVYVCMSDFANLCRPCQATADCKAQAGAEDVCVVYGVEGSFCGGTCLATQDCPWGFSCKPSTTVDGIETMQCVADAGVCPCTARSVELFLWTPCQVSNEVGTCRGASSSQTMGVDDFPGFDAILSLSWLKLAALVGGAEKGLKYQQLIDDCLLQKNGVKECIPGEPPKPYTNYLSMVGLDMGCKTNWNNHNMSQLAMFSLIRDETDPKLKALYRKALKTQMWEPDDSLPMRDQQKTLYTMFYLINKTPTDPWPEDAARDALCTMKRFREHKAHFAVDNISKYKTVCTARDDDPMTDFVLPIDEQAMDNYLWGGNPYELEVDPGDPQLVESPEDYLLAYWMARYYGFITPEM